MTYQRFEDLPVWNEAIRLAEGCEDFLLEAKDRISFSKRDQLDRCSLSASSSLSGFECLKAGSPVSHFLKIGGLDFFGTRFWLRGFGGVKGLRGSRFPPCFCGGSGRC
jgi:hypothetical protein